MKRTLTVPLGFIARRRFRLSIPALVLLLSALHPPLSTVLAQGPLAPPGGPAPTMKTLDQVEARTPIAGGTSTRSINASGSYYLTGNINISDGSNAIVIAADNVTLDLNGFAIVSTSNSAAGAGVLITGERRSVAITNGNISGSVAYVGGGDQFTGPGFAHGIRIDSGVEGARVSHVSVSGCDQDAILVFSSGRNSTVTDCTVAVAGGTGIIASVVHNSSVRECGGSGISANSVMNCHARTHGFAASISAVTASNCHGICGSTGSGVEALAASNCHGETSLGLNGLEAQTATGCTGRAGTGVGLRAETATNCTGISQSGTGLYAEVAQNCRGVSVGGDGLFANYMATNSQGITNAGRGLFTSIATNCFGQTLGGDLALFAHSANNCRGWQTDGVGIAIFADIAVGCTTAGGTINCPSKHLGTP